MPPEHLKCYQIRKRIRDRSYEMWYQPGNSEDSVLRELLLKNPDCSPDDFEITCSNETWAQFMKQYEGNGWTGD